MKFLLRQEEIRVFHTLCVLRRNTVFHWRNHLLSYPGRPLHTRLDRAIPAQCPAIAQRAVERIRSSTKKRPHRREQRQWSRDGGWAFGVGRHLDRYGETDGKFHVLISRRQLPPDIPGRVIMVTITPHPRHVLTQTWS
jgi:hypothetical protein